MRGIWDDTRGASEVMGAGLLIAIVLAGALVTLTVGTSLIGDAQETSDRQQSEAVLQSIDADLASLTQNDDASRVRIDFGDTNPREYHIRESGRINITINDRGDCSASIPLTSMRYEDSSGSVVAYQAGGVWRYDENSGRSSMVTRPSVGYHNGRLSVSVVNLSGVADQAPNPVRHDSAASRATTTDIESDLAGPSNACIRSDNVTLTVTSDFHVAWGQYLASELGVDVTSDPVNRTVTATLHQSELPDHTNDSQNQVVNLSGASYMTTASVVENPDQATITVDKGANNTYLATVEPLHQQTPPVGNITTLENGTVRKPVDVVLTIDDSFSIYAFNRKSDINSSAPKLVGALNESSDRVGIVTYDFRPFYNTTAHDRYISGNFTAVNDTLESYGRDTGFTDMYGGLDYADSLLLSRSDENRDRYVVLLGDGNHSNFLPGSEEDILDLVRGMEQRGVRTYTIGYGVAAGSEPERQMKNIAENGSGQYYSPSNAADLGDTFTEIAENVTGSGAMTRTPLSVNVTTNGSVHGSEIPESDDHIPAGTVGGHDFKNINDPRTGSVYTSSLPVQGGDAVTIEAYEFDCTGSWAATDQEISHEGGAFLDTYCTQLGSHTIREPEVLLDGDTLPSDIHTDLDYGDVWQEDINATIHDRGDMSINVTTGELGLPSNTALLYYDYPDGDDSANSLLLVYEVGLAESDAEIRSTVDVEVEHVVFE